MFYAIRRIPAWGKNRPFNEYYAFHTRSLRDYFTQTTPHAQPLPANSYEVRKLYKLGAFRVIGGYAP